MKKKSQHPKTFHFKQFSVSGGECGMPVSTDGVLLGAWMNGENLRSILDIGTGTGLLALFCAQRFPTAQITALDIDQQAIQTAIHNRDHSPWASRIKVEHQDILTFVPQSDYDAIICNPPYFTSGQVSIAPARALARHVSGFSHQQLLHHCQHLLSPSGELSMILPCQEGDSLIDSAKQLGWFLTRSCLVSPTETKPPSRILFSLSRTEPQACEFTQLTIRTQNSYTPAFTELTKAFYLKM
ncbi:tRNA1(Val) (adenine(37)-N6)-methyltransferase [Vibrio sp. MEBiC08052]|uniref:tRNA1(Val) (adenine(37)-N6)-methyltransferase n=1 Tax=Vibrio sp. MEBiC08052 TaxID=1761910 RepID=UPI00074061B8|nr:methyltransferase [Vibrio sp. MEBiC08052]KUJ00449.1 putative O-methyltransferase [Vibrio sp. MEBiC08052]